MSRADNFLEKSNRVHESVYSYDNIDYINNFTKVLLIMLYISRILLILAV